MRSIERTRRRMQEQPPPRTPVRERIFEAADMLLPKGLVGASLDELAGRAQTSLAVILREFGSPDNLVAEWLKRVAAEQDAEREAFRGACIREEECLQAWLDETVKRIKDPSRRGCKLSAAAMHLKEMRLHIAGPVVRQAKSKEWSDLANLCREADYEDCIEMASKLLLLIEGARMCTLTLGENGPVRELEAAIAAILRQRKPKNDEAGPGESTKHG